MKSNLLFVDGDWFSYERQVLSEIDQEIATYNCEQLLNTSTDDMSEYFIAKHKAIIPTIRRDAISLDQREIQIARNKVDPYFDSSILQVFGNRYATTTANQLDIYVPFDGDPTFFYIKPSQFTMNPPHGKIENDCLILTFIGQNMNESQIRLELNNELDKIEKYLSNLQKNAEALHQQIAMSIKEKIENRKEKILKDKNLVASLGFPIKEKADARNTYVTPNVKRKLDIIRPHATTKAYEPEPTLDEENYELILNTLTNMSFVMEQNPSAFSSLNEEGIRSHFLVQLNGHFEGQATGETFNFTGKTDIIIKDKGKNIFIGECKFWKGAKVLTETINQILGYSSWRDTKTAILLFNKNKDCTKVLESIPPTVEEHPNFKRFVKKPTETSFRYVFRHNEDTNRELHLTILLFNIPSAPKESKKLR